MPFDKMLIFLAVFLASILQVVAYHHYVDHSGIIYITAVLYCLQIALCIKYILDGKFSFHSILILLIMAGIIGDYFDFNAWKGSKILKLNLAVSYIMIGILFIRKAWNHHQHPGFIERLTFPVTATILLFQAVSFIAATMPSNYVFNNPKIYFAIILLGNTLNYAIIALCLTMLYNNKYRLLMLPGEIRMITLIAFISCFPIIENFFMELLGSL
jgi:hypothetical protein